MKTLSLPDGRVDLWLAFEHEIDDDELLSEYRLLLNEDERRLESKFYFEHDQRRHVITRALVRTVLSRYSDKEPFEWAFGKNEYGRPEVSNRSARERLLWFNVSHTAGLIVCGVGPSQCLGVDVELIDQERCPLSMADGYLSKQELRHLRSLDPTEQVDAFFQLWTLKEAYVKAQGIGLSLPLDKFSFNISSRDYVSISFKAPLRDDPERLAFVLLNPTERHLLSVCTDCTGKSEIDLVVRKVIPLRREEVVGCPVLRESPPSQLRIRHGKRMH